MSSQTKAQNNKPVSAADKAAIIKLFKGVDKSLYRLQFNKSKEVYGKKQFSMSEVEQINQIRNPGSANGYVVVAYRDDGVMYLLAVTGKKIDQVLGQERARQLNAIMTKYAR